MVKNINSKILTLLGPMKNKKNINSKILTLLGRMKNKKI